MESPKTARGLLGLVAKKHVEKSAALLLLGHLDAGFCLRESRRHLDGGEKGNQQKDKNTLHGSVRNLVPVYQTEVNKTMRSPLRYRVAEARASAAARVIKPSAISPRAAWKRA
jgi:hypothetical protein